MLGVYISWFCGMGWLGINWLEVEVVVKVVVEYVCICFDFFFGVVVFLKV